MKRQHWLIFFGILTAAVMTFIFTHSMMSIPESAQQSLGLLAILKPIFDPNNRFSEEFLHNFIRKLAHFVEFGALGVCTGGFTTNLGWLHSKRYISLPMLITLATAVCDEFIQYFYERGSMVTDVVLDYSGALTGLLTVAAFVWLQAKLAVRKEIKETL